MIVILDSKRRLTIPAALVAANPGDRFDVRFNAEDDTVVCRRLSTKEDWLQVLQVRPVVMDDLPPRRKSISKDKKL